MGNIDVITQLLATHGPWALVAVSGVVIWRMAVHIVTTNQRHREELVELLREQKKESREVVEQVVEALVSTKQALETMQAALWAALK